MTPNPWPIIAPDDDDLDRAARGLPLTCTPAWNRLSSARCRGPLGSDAFADPELDAQKEAAAAARKQAYLDRLQASREAAEARQREREAAQAIRLAEGQRKRLEARLARAEASRQRQAERRAREPLSPEERSRRIREGMAQAKAAGRIPVKKPRAPRVYPRSPNKVAPEGMVPLGPAARANGYSPVYLARACKEGRLPAVQKGHYWYVREADVPAFRAREAAIALKVRRRNAETARKAKAAKPWARLCPRKRKTA